MDTDFGSLFEFLPIGAYRSRPDGSMLRANPALVRLNGFETEAEQLAAVHDIAGRWYVDPSRRDEFQRLMARDGRVVGFESEVRRYKTGERIWISENAYVVREPDGRPRHYEGTVEEITERVRERDALQRSEQHLRAITAQVPGVVYRTVLQPDGTRRIDFISEGVRELLGIEPEQALADPLVLTQYRHADDSARVVDATRRAALLRAPLSVDFRMVRPDGMVKWVHQTSVSMPGPDGSQLRIGVMLDAGERQQAEALRRERDLAAAADRAKSAFLSRVSHELRTPLNAVLGFAQLLELEPGDGERQRRWVSQVISSGRHLLALMDDVLDISSAQTGQLPLNLEPLALQPLVAETLGMLSGTAAAAGVHLHDETAAAAPLTLHGDRKRVLQVLSNLISNAIKYNRPGGWVRLRAEAAEAQVVLSVADSGPGLNATQRARLFEPFERLDAHRSTVPGTGLGLALARQFTHAMGGEVEVDSEPGQGSVFRLRLPAA